jgi:hypothetical protein
MAPARRPECQADDKKHRPRAGKHGAVPKRSASTPASVTPTECPRKSVQANSARLLPRCAGAICVAFTCSVLCSM